MSGTKFLVLQMKDLIKVGAIILVGIVLLIFALIFLIGRSGNNAQNPENQGVFNPGVYSSTIVLNNKPVEIRVTVNENEIVSIYMTDMAEIQQIFFPLFEPRMNDLALEVLYHQTAYIVPETDYPVTTDILQRAVKAALQQAVRH